MDLSKEWLADNAYTAVSAKGEKFEVGDVVWYEPENDDPIPVKIRDLNRYDPRHRTGNTETLYARCHRVTQGRSYVVWLTQITHDDPRPKPAPIEDTPDCYGTY